VRANVDAVRQSVMMSGSGTEEPVDVTRRVVGLLGYS
jgi:hypothetical protein